MIKLGVEKMRANVEEFEARERRADLAAFAKALDDVDRAAKRLRRRGMSEAEALSPALRELRSAYYARLKAGK